MKLKVKPEGRDGVWLAEKRNVAMWLLRNLDGPVHNFIEGPVFFGADWSLSSVIDCVRKCERLAILTGNARRRNMNHALSVISAEKLYMFDIGTITENDLQISA